MQKKIIALLTILILFAFAAPTFAAPLVLLDNQLIKFDVDPIVENESVLVQMRPIFEAMGASLQWDNPTQTATATRGATIIKLTIDNYTAYVNGYPLTLDVPARIVNGSTMVPLRFISESLGATANYDPDTGFITLTSPPISTVSNSLTDNSSNTDTSINNPIEEYQAVDYGGVTVYVTRTGEKYHQSWCRYLSKSKIPMNLSDAIASGYTACSVCY